jgi:hypothetical protein
MNKTRTERASANDLTQVQENASELARPLAMWSETSFKNSPIRQH